MSAMNDTPEHARRYAQRLFQLRPRSCRELRQRLVRKGFSEAVTEETLAFFEKVGYLDDLKFATLWVTSRLNSRPRSRAMLRRELAEKGVAGDIVEQVLRTLTEDDDREQARRIARRQWMHSKSLGQDRARRRVAGYLSRRGFSRGLIYAIIKELE